MENLGIKPHGLTNQKSNRVLNKEEEVADMKNCLHSFFEGLKDEAETHATRVVQEATGVSLRDKEIDAVELPSSFTNQGLYYRFCFQSGYVVNSDAKGRMPSMKNYPVCTTYNLHYPEGSQPKFFCDWKAFWALWKDNYSNMKICSPANDTCNKCWKYWNELVLVLRLENNNIRRQVHSKSNMVSEVVQELDVQVDDNSTNLSQANNSNNDQEVETYDSELLRETEFSPPLKILFQNSSCTLINILRCTS